MNALPIIACLYPTIILQLITNKNNLISDFYKNNIIYTNKIKFKTALSSDFIILEREERKRISNGINDNLIEKHNNYILELSISDFSTKINNIDFGFNFEFELNNSVKELFWTIDIFLNNYKINNKINDEINDEINNNINNFVLSTIFTIDDSGIGLHKV